MSRISLEEAKREGEENVSGTMNRLVRRSWKKNEKQVGSDYEGS